MFTTTRMLPLTILCCLIAVSFGCADTPEDADAETAQWSPVLEDSVPAAEEDHMTADDDADDPPIEYDGPKFDFAIEVMESMPEQYALAWIVTANTGGWTLTTDDVEHTGTSAQVYVTLVRPGPDEIVTQALVTHRGRHDAGTAEIARAELHVRLITRGVGNDVPYKLAAIAP